MICCLNLVKYKHQCGSLCNSIWEILKVIHFYMYLMHGGLNMTIWHPGGFFLKVNFLSVGFDCWSKVWSKAWIQAIITEDLWHGVAMLIFGKTICKPVRWFLNQDRESPFQVTMISHVKLIDIRVVLCDTRLVPKQWSCCCQANKVSFIFFSSSQGSSCDALKYGVQ